MPRWTGAHFPPAGLNAFTAECMRLLRPLASHHPITENIFACSSTLTHFPRRHGILQWVENGRMLDRQSDGAPPSFPRTCGPPSLLLVAGRP
ncbi:hypothetical protein IG631_22861 [Alternaria alternata]|nr:hypothetical protein IG631_22861 [Alternaria alternata]